MKVVINPTVGGFSVSDAVQKELGIDPPKRFGQVGPRDLGYEGSHEMEAFRSDIRLIGAIETVGCDKAHYNPAKHLAIIEVPNDVDWRLWMYEDGSEGVHEVHRVWDEDGERRM